MPRQQQSQIIVKYAYLDTKVLYLELINRRGTIIITVFNQTGVAYIEMILMMVIMMMIIIMIKMSAKVIQFERR